MSVHKFGIHNKFSSTKGDADDDTGVSINYLNNNFHRRDGKYEMIGDLNMGNNTITNLIDPTQNDQVATKNYVDNIQGGGFLERTVDGDYVAADNLNMNNKRIENVAFPVEDNDAANRIYVDSKSNQLRNYFDSNSPFVIANGDANEVGNKFQTQNNLHMMNFKIKELGEPTEETDAVNKKYVDENINNNLENDLKKYVDDNNAFSVRRDGRYVAKGAIILSQNKLGGLRDPIKGGEAASKKYVDDQINSYVDKLKNDKGDIVASASINMYGNRVLGLPIPNDLTEAANREYVDNVGQNAREYTDRTSELLGRRITEVPTAFLKDNGNYVARLPLSMGAQSLTDLTTPKRENDAVTKKYVDDIIADNVKDGGIAGVGDGEVFFKENGNYQASQNINMGFKELVNLPLPNGPSDAVNKKYVDDEIEKTIMQYVDRALQDKKPVIFLMAELNGNDFEWKDSKPLYYSFDFGFSHNEIIGSVRGDDFGIGNFVIIPVDGRLIRYGVGYSYKGSYQNKLPVDLKISIIIGGAEKQDEIIRINGDSNYNFGVLDRFKPKDHPLGIFIYNFLNKTLTPDIGNELIIRVSLLIELDL